MIIVGKVYKAFTLKEEIALNNSASELKKIIKQLKL